jgi:hypothetical protein
LWRELQLDDFWADRLPPSRKGTRWDQVLQVLVAYRLIAPGSEWKLHRDWFGKSARDRPKPGENKASRASRSLIIPLSLSSGRTDDQ